MNEFIFGEGLIYTAEGKLTPQMALKLNRVDVYPGRYMGVV